MTMALPTTRAFLTSLITSIPSSTLDSPTSIANPLRTLDQEDRNIVLTLHVLFPNELLPALDLLDRNLVTRLRLTSQPHSETPPDHPLSSYYTYHVRSAQQPSTSSRGSSSRYSSTSSRYQDPLATSQHYQVRPTAWNCTCPAFAFAAFPAQPPPVDVESTTTDWKGKEATGGWTFGGLSRGQDTPVCKHLLACVLVEHCALFSGFVSEREVGVDEMAGWCAGWGA